ncbi:MAG: adenosylmethionine--8-amino-7-oxononanoate transaminase [Legionella sp.]|jgi:adenosylmethionine-8-amino-7-oxononanoate aminotransferase
MHELNPLIAKDLQHIWHPCSQMKDFETCPPLVVTRAKGSYLYTNKGPLIDAISSWWCKSLGHGHPAVLAAISQQLEYFEHIIGANTTHACLVELAELLAEITGNQHAFFASDGATAVEIAMKLAIHGMQIRGFKDKNQFIALKNSYHGESLATLSISDLGIYKAPYSGFGVSCHFIENIPYINTVDDDLWLNCDSHWHSILSQIEPIKDKVCAVIVEPLIQGAGGMLCYSQDLLKKLAQWAKVNDIYLIADEIMTGIGRTGTWLACDKAQVHADLVCLSKGLTSGALPLSCVTIDKAIYELFYADYNEGKSFLHSNTYSCNALAISAALATIKTIKNEAILEKTQALGTLMLEQLNEVARLSGALCNVRGIGAVVAADLIGSERMGNALYQEALELGALIRPIGNTLYWLPPLNTDTETIGKLSEITLQSIIKVKRI